MSVLPEFIQYVSQMETRKYPSYVNLVTNPAHENYRVYGGEDPTAGNQSGKLPEMGRAGDSRAASSESCFENYRYCRYMGTCQGSKGIFHRA
ncbi:hypothetical protein WAI453_001138 [Rhynchosporium graminicola]